MKYRQTCLGFVREKTIPDDKEKMNNNVTEEQPEMEPRRPAETDSQTEKLHLLLDFLSIHKNLIITVTVGVLVLAGGFVFFLQQRQAAEKKAGGLVALASVNAQIGNWQLAIDGDGEIKGFRDIIKEYGSTPSGNLAKIMAGNSFLSLQQVDSALAYYGSYSGKNRDLAASAKAGEAICFLEKQEQLKAANAFEQAAEKADNQALKALYLADAADACRSAGEIEKAVALYKKTIRNYPGFAGAVQAEKALLALAGKTGDVDL